jgi:hypothetical protein
MPQCNSLKHPACMAVGLIFLVLLTGSLAAQVEPASPPPPPEVFFGFKPGSDGNLFTYEELVQYLKKLSEQSPRIRMVENGSSPYDRPMYICFISAEENIRQLEYLKDINKKLALDTTLTPAETAGLIAAGKVFVLATLSMHADEIAPAQSLPLLAYDLATTRDPAVLERMKEVVLMMVPNHNPDGMDMIVEHYRKYKGTKYETTDMPGLYHKYVGHDNNRDFITLSQQDTRAIARIYNLDWFPQVMVEKHQMGSSGPRYFVPPVHDPIAENIDAGIWNWSGIFGSNLITDLTARGLAGVSQHFLFDDYWPGSTETCIWKNVIGFLTEAASVYYATPMYVEPTELRVHGKGLAEYKKSINMPLPWPGGWWRLGDIVQLEYESMLSILKTAYLNKKDILKFRNDLCRREIRLGETVPPYYYIVPLSQHDPGELVRLVALLQEHGVNCYRLNRDTTLQRSNYRKGDVVLPLAQPFRPFIKEVMEKQEYPLRHYTPGGEIIKPYDITSWSLPLHRGLKSVEISTPHPGLEQLLEPIAGELRYEKTAPPQDFKAVVLPVNENDSYRAVFRLLQQGLKIARFKEDRQQGSSRINQGDFLVIPDPANRGVIEQVLQGMVTAPVFLEKPAEGSATPVTMPRIALVETYFHDMDAGWTRFVLDSYSIPFTVLRPGDFKKTDFTKKYDILIFPDNDKSILLEGKWKSEEREDYYLSSYPPEFTAGIGKEGFQQVVRFIEQGGIVVAWGGSTNLFKGILNNEISKDNKEEFRLPFNNVAADLKKAGLYCPGSLVRIKLISGHALTLGMPEETGVFFRGDPVFTTSIPDFDMDRRVIGKFPEKDILLSGYCEKQDLLANKCALIWLKKGQGQLVLMGFNPQFRASTMATYKILFNALLLRKNDSR